MGRDYMVRWVAQKEVKTEDGIRIQSIGGMTKKELEENIRYAFNPGDSVLIYRQSTMGIGQSKRIIVGQPFILPKPDEDVLRDEIEEYMRREQ